jgi:hypothetical protein
MGIGCAVTGSSGNEQADLLANRGIDELLRA